MSMYLLEFISTLALIYDEYNCLYLSILVAHNILVISGYNKESCELVFYLSKPSLIEHLFGLWGRLFQRLSLSQMSPFLEKISEHDDLISGLSDSTLQNLSYTLQNCCPPSNTLVQKHLVNLLQETLFDNDKKGKK